MGSAVLIQAVDKQGVGTCNNNIGCIRRVSVGNYIDTYKAAESEREKQPAALCVCVCVCGWMSYGRYAVEPVVNYT